MPRTQNVKIAARPLPSSAEYDVKRTCAKPETPWRQARSDCSGWRCSAPKARQNVAESRKIVIKLKIVEIPFNIQRSTIILRVAPVGEKLIFEGEAK